MTELGTKTLIAAFAITILATLAIAAAVDIYLLQTTGIYQEYGLTLTPSAVDWATVTQGTPVTQSVNITNTGTKPVTSLTASYGNETPNLLNYTLTWDCEGSPLLVDSWIMANFTLTVYNCSGVTFGFDIYIGDNA